MNELAVRNESVSFNSMDEIERAAKAMVASGFFADSKQASQAVVKILAGRELGFGPFASMTGVNIIQNKPVLAANLMAAAVKRQGKYNYRITHLDDTGCNITFFEGGQEVGVSKFDKADADKAGLTGKDNWKKYPRNMYFARALSNGQKWYAPDVFNGATVYTPDELGAVVDEEGNMIQETKIEYSPSIKADLDTIDEDSERLDKDFPKPARPYSPAEVKERFETEKKKFAGMIAEGKQRGATANHRQVLAAGLGKIFLDNTQRYELCQWLTGEASTKNMDAASVFAMLAWLNVKSFEDEPNGYSLKEAISAHAEALKASGQEELIPA